MNKYVNYIIGKSDALTEEEQKRVEKAAKIVLGAGGIPRAAPTVLYAMMEQIKQNVTPSYAFEAKNLILDKSYFPTKNSPKEVNTYWNKHKNECDDLFKLQRFASSIAYHPAFQDIPLYEAARLIAAVSECLEKSDGKVVLLGGCINGIQTYLYDLVSKNAAKLLKGRSFYVQLLVDSIILKINAALGLSEQHKVYASGGGFFLIAPENCIEEFDKICKIISDEIYKEHKTSLYVSFAKSVAFDENTKLQTIWSELIDDLEIQKYRRLNDRLSSSYAEFFEASEQGGLEYRDVITNEEITKGEQKVPFDKREEDVKEYIKKSTDRQIELGRFLSRAAAWEISNEGNENEHINNRYFYFKTLESGKNYFHFMSDKLASKANNPTFFNKTDEPKFVFYGGNKVPLKENDEPKSFDELAKNDALTRLAVLRMDVDNLGAHFKENIKGANLARYATLSSQLDYFFKGYLNVLRETYKDTIIIIYSGGDDLFIVGKWNDVINLSLDIHDNFKKWACENPNLSISGGIAIVDEKFPIMQAARMSGDAEKLAKNHKVNGQDRNSIYFLNMALKWEKELPLVQDLFKELLGFLVSREVSMNLITKIGKYAAARQQYDTDLVAYNDKKISVKPSPKWVWNMLYDFKRYADNCKKDSEAEKFVKTIAASMISNKYKKFAIAENRHFLDYINLAARWAELEKRTQNI